MLQPKKTKFRRMQKGRMKGIAQRGNQLAYGSFAIKALDSAWITGRQIEAARQAITRYMKREGQLWIRIFPDKPITKKPAEVRMGKGIAQRGNQLAYGSFAIKALDSAWITGRQIEAARQAITRYMKREGQLWIRIFPDKPITKKPAEVRMGKGKGNPEGFVAPVTPGRILFEAEGVPLAVAQEALRLGAQKLPITTKFIVRRDFVETSI